MNKITDTSALSLLTCVEGFDPIEDGLRANIRDTIEAVFNEELDGFLGRLRYGRKAWAVKGYRHGNRERQITGTFGTETISVPRARIADDAGKVHEWRSKRVAALPAADQDGRSADRIRLSLGHEHAACKARSVPRCSRELSARMWSAGRGAR